MLTLDEIQRVHKMLIQTGEFFVPVDRHYSHDRGPGFEPIKRREDAGYGHFRYRDLKTGRFVSED